MESRVVPPNGISAVHPGIPANPIGPRVFLEALLPGTKVNHDL